MIIEVSSGEDIGIVLFLFPRYPLVTQLSSFIRDDGVIFVSEKKIPDQKYTVVQVKKSSRYPLNTKEGFLLFLEEVRNLKIPQPLRDLDDESFWQAAKMFTFSKSVKQNVESSFTTFDLFKSLFGTIDEKYNIYKSLGQSHHQVISSLITMMSRVKDHDNASLSPGYRKVLIQNRPYFSLFCQKLMKYFSSDRKEMDFIELLNGLDKGQQK